MCFCVLGSSATSSGLEEVGFCRSFLCAQKNNPLLPEPGAPEVSPVWVVCALQLWHCCGCCAPTGGTRTGSRASCLWCPPMTVARNLVGMRSPSAEATCGGPSQAETTHWVQWDRDYFGGWTGQGKCPGLGRSAGNAKTGWTVLARRQKMLKMACLSWTTPVGNFFKMMPASALVPKRKFSRPLSLWYFP